MRDELGEAAELLGRCRVYVAIEVFCRRCWPSSAGRPMTRPVSVGRSVNRKMSTVLHVQRRRYAGGTLRRTIAIVVSLTWITGSLACPVPALAHEAGHPSAPAAPAHEHSHGDSHSNDQSDLCCEILGQVEAAASSLNNPLYYPSAPAHAPLPVDGFKLVAAAAIDEATSLQLHGPPPPRRSWPQFTKVWSQAPPADHI